MFSWLRRRHPSPPQATTPTPPAPPAPPPPTSPTTPAGYGTQIKVAFSNGEHSWTEEANLLVITHDVLRHHGHATAPAGKDTLRLEPHGLTLRPALQNLQPLHPKGAQTVTTLHLAHPAFEGAEIFEYQHSTGDSVESALRKGVDQWAQVDLPVLLDALLDKPARCTMMNMVFPAKDGRPARARRIVLGPVAHFAQATPLPPEPPADSQYHPPFCACCFLTNNFDAFKSLVESDGVHAIRFYAARNPDGSPEADCRVNGHDFPDGAAALRRYATTWPPAGFEFRKQYVLMQNDPAPAPQPAAT